MINFKNIAGQKFGRLTALALVGSSRSQKKIWICQCDCGNTINVISGNLVQNKTRSCGCLRSETSHDHATQINKGNSFSVTHGETRNVKETTEYQAWRAMKDRCLRLKNSAFRYYGGRGIKICERWINSFENFLLDMGRKPNKTFSLDRIDPNQGYNPSNCRWATKQIQILNRRKYYVFSVNAASLGNYEGLGLA